VINLDRGVLGGWWGRRARRPPAPPGAVLGMGMLHNHSIAGRAAVATNQKPQPRAAARCLLRKASPGKTDDEPAHSHHHADDCKGQPLRLGRCDRMSIKADKPTRTPMADQPKPTISAPYTAPGTPGRFAALSLNPPPKLGGGVLLDGSH
jgi:hypothetical protein